MNCTVTSPPYFAQRNYGVDGQIGLEETPQEFTERLVEVFNEVWRVTRQDGSLWLNLGDSYNGSGKCTGRTWENGNIPNMSRKQYSNAGSLLDRRTKVEGLKPKDLIGIPWMVAFALRDSGWYLRSAIPWIKPNQMPESVEDRPTNAHEYIFLFSKSDRYFYDMDAVRIPLAESSIGRAGRKQKLIDRTGAGTLGKQIESGVDQSHGYAGLALGRNGKTGYDMAGRNRRTSDWLFDSIEDYIHYLTALKSGWGMWSDLEGNPLAILQPTVPTTWEFCKACGTLYQADTKKLVTKEVVDEKTIKRCPCGATNAWVAHFATFPERLIEPLILAGCPLYQCGSCGKPYQRRVERTTSFESGSGKAGRTPEEVNNSGKWAGKQYGKNIKLGPVNSYQTVGWTADCDCEVEIEAGIVLDPFAGSGTTALVAARLDRNFVGCDLNPDYVAVANARLGQKRFALELS